MLNRTTFWNNSVRFSQVLLYSYLHYILLYRLYSYLYAELDIELGDLHVDIADKESRIMLHLVEELMRHSSALVKLVDAALYLDVWVVAFNIFKEKNVFWKYHNTQQIILKIVVIILWSFMIPSDHGSIIVGRRQHKRRIIVITGLKDLKLPISQPFFSTFHHS